MDSVKSLLGVPYTYWNHSDIRLLTLRTSETSFSNTFSLKILNLHGPFNISKFLQIVLTLKHWNICLFWNYRPTNYGKPWGFRGFPIPASLNWFSSVLLATPVSFHSVNCEWTSAKQWHIRKLDGRWGPSKPSDIHLSR